jgi:hypothetical protein
MPTQIKVFGLCFVTLMALGAMQAQVTSVSGSGTGISVSPTTGSVVVQNTTPLTSSALQSVLAASPFNITVGGYCGLPDGDESAFIYQDAANPSGTPTCSAFWGVSSTNPDWLVGEDLSGDGQIVLDATTGSGFFSAAVTSYGFNATGQKITSVANGNASTDAAAFGQIIPNSFSANQTVTQGAYTMSWGTAASSSTANMFTLTDSSTTSAPGQYTQPGHLFQVTTVPGSYLNPFAVYSQTTPNIGNTIPNASFEITNGLDAGRGDAHLMLSNFTYNSTATYGTTPSANQLEMNGLWKGPGFDLGNNGTSAEGWTVGKMFAPAMTIATRGIHQMFGGSMSKSSQGDTDMFYTYLTAFGGAVASSDEAVVHTGAHLFQMGFLSGTITAGGTTGSAAITASTTCHNPYGSIDGACSFFADGGILLNTQTAGITASIVDCGSPSGQPSFCATSSTGLNGTYYDISGATVTPSTAWGNITPSTCTGNGNGQYQTYTSTTCTVTLGSGSGNFNTSTHIFLSGPFEEEASVVSVGTPSGGSPNTQSVTFSTRYAWGNANGNTNGALVMQGGPGGQSFIATGSLSSWPIAYAVVGATSSTRIYFSNCIDGSCNGRQSSNIISLASTNSFSSSGTITRTSNVVTFNIAGSSSPYRIYLYPVGSQVALSGWSPSDLNGTYTVTSNTMDRYSPVITWNQTATNEVSTTTGAVSQPNSEITFYPSAFIIGTNNGSYGVAQLATNAVPFGSGDAVVGSPTSEDQQTGHVLYQGQSTPNDGSISSVGYLVADAGPSPMYAQYSAITNGTASASPTMFNVQGAFNNIFHLYYRPANNGALLHVGSTDPSSLNIPYSIFFDDDGGQLAYYPANYPASPTQGSFQFSGDVVTKGRIAPQQSTPANSSATCSAGEMWTDASYIYVCTATNTIKRAALSSF